MPGQNPRHRGHNSSFANGINGIMIDMIGLLGDPMAADSRIQVGNDNNVSRLGRGAKSSEYHDPDREPASPAATES